MDRQTGGHQGPHSHPFPGLSKPQPLSLPSGHYPGWERPLCYIAAKATSSAFPATARLVQLLTLNTVPAVVERGEGQKGSEKKDFCGRTPVPAETAPAAEWGGELGVLAWEQKVHSLALKPEVRNHCSKQTRTVCMQHRNTSAGCKAPSASLCCDSTGKCFQHILKSQWKV